jgi:phenylalanyl-tRNA synthetase beta chain
VIVRTARQGEKMLSLDGDNLTLKPDMLVIADSKTPIALAGIIGGTNTSVTEETSAILIEAANFDASSVRRTRTELGINTEASYRFERGPRQELVPIALRRVTKMILDIAGGHAERGIMDLYPNPNQVPAVSISSDRIKAVLGVTLDIDNVKETLTNLGFRQSADDKTNDLTLKMEIPYWRSDISMEEDLIEEVARIKGYDSIPTTMPSTPIPHHKPQPFIQFRETLRDRFVSAGMQEIISYSATSLNSLKAAKSFCDNKPPVKISNPLSSELEYMRTTLRSGVLETLSYNHRNSRGRGIKIFEIGRVYLPKTKGTEFNLPKEPEMLVGAITGPQLPVTWLGPEEKVDFYDAKGLLESVLSSFSLNTIYQTTEDPLMHPGKTARIVCGTIPIGIVGEVQTSLLANLELHDDPVILFEINLQSLFQNTQGTDFAYSSISKFPDSERDLALLIDSAISSSDVQIVINRHKLVSTSTAFDLYTGSGVPAHKKSLAFRIVFQSSKATLTTAQIDKAQQDIMNQLKREFGAELRE